MLSPESAARYLERIELSPSEDRSLKRLDLMHDRHLLCVPFENLDIHRDVEIKLDLDAIFQKIVVKRRGGFCYELNGLFYELLRQCGYDVFMASARVYGPNGPGIVGDHLVLIVTIDGQRYVADVGFGDSFRRPLPLLLDTEHRQFGESFRIVKGGDELIYQRLDRESHEWANGYTFTMEPRNLDFFADACRWQQTAPESHFLKHRLVTKVIPDGRITLTADRLILTRGPVKTETPVPDLETWVKELRRHFGMTLDR